MKERAFGMRGGETEKSQRLEGAGHFRKKNPQDDLGDKMTDGGCGLVREGPGCQALGDRRGLWRAIGAEEQSRGSLRVHCECSAQEEQARDSPRNCLTGSSIAWAPPEENSRCLCQPPSDQSLGGCFVLFCFKSFLTI